MACVLTGETFVVRGLCVVVGDADANREAFVMCGVCMVGEHCLADVLCALFAARSS